jgi:hypothetical protein
MNIRSWQRKDLYKGLSEDKRFELEKAALDVEKIRLQVPKRLEEREDVAHSMIWSRVCGWLLAILIISLTVGLNLKLITTMIVTQNIAKYNYSCIDGIVVPNDKVAMTLDYRLKQDIYGGIRKSDNTTMNNLLTYATLLYKDSPKTLTDTLKSDTTWKVEVK